MRNSSRAAARQGGARNREDRGRVLLVGDLPPPAHGQSVSFGMLCRELPKRGFRCRIVDLARRGRAPWGRFSARRCGEMLTALAKYAGALAAGHRRVYLLIARSRAGFLRDMAMIWSAWLCGGRIAVHVKGGYYDGFYEARSPLGRFFVRHTLRRVRRVIVLSERLRTMYQFDSRVAARVAVAMNATPRPLCARQRALRRDGRAKLLYLSNLIQSKGYMEAVEATAILRREMGVDAEIVLAGRFDASDDDEVSLTAAEAEARFNRRVEELELGNAVRYAGPVTGDRKWRLFGNSDFFLLPTRYRYEGQPISIIEAMAHGCVVVSTDYRAIPDLVVDGETGVLLADGEPWRIADAVANLVADPDRYAAMSAAAAQRYRERFTIERHLEAMESILERL